MLHESFMQRLAFIRYLYNMAVEQSRQPEPLGAASILTFHDSVELFLQLACEHLNVETKKNLGFMEYWDLLAPKLADDKLTQKVPMRRLNDTRVSLKHHGTLPSTLTIEGSRASVTNFFEENTPLVFGIEFGSISMTNLVKCAEARSSLEEASRLIQEGKPEDAIDKIAVAFVQLVGDYEKSGQTWYGHSPFYFGKDLKLETSFSMGIEDRKAASFVDNTNRRIGALQGVVKILSLGLDYRRYVKFIRLAPHVTRFPGGDSGDRYEIARLRKTELPSIEEYRFCYDFVIDSAIRLQEFEVGVEK